MDFTNGVAFTQTQRDGSQILFVAELESVSSHPAASPRILHNFRRMGSVVGPRGGPGSGPETYRGLSTSPSNLHVVASSTLSGVDVGGGGYFTDENSYVYDMVRGSPLCSVNETNFSDVNSRNTQCPAYDMWKVAQAGRFSAADLDRDTWQISWAHNGNPEPLGPIWTRAETFFLGYRLDVVSTFLRGFTMGGFNERVPFVRLFDVNGRVLRYDVQDYSGPFRAADRFGLRGGLIVFDGHSVSGRGSLFKPDSPELHPVSADHVAGYRPMF